MVKSQGNNIVLIGFMGSGKTTVGKRLAEKLGYDFIDTDKMIEEQEQERIGDIFDKRGEECFRTMETRLLSELSPAMSRTILSTGGGMPLREENRRLLKEMGTVIYLKTSVEVTFQRVMRDTSRPLLRGEDLRKKITDMLAERNPIYESTAHKIIVTDGLSPEGIAGLILRKYKSDSTRRSDYETTGD